MPQSRVRHNEKGIWPERFRQPTELWPWSSKKIFGQQQFHFRWLQRTFSYPTNWLEGTNLHWPGYSTDNNFLSSIIILPLRGWANAFLLIFRRVAAAYSPVGTVSAVLFWINPCRDGRLTVTISKWRTTVPRATTRPDALCLQVWEITSCVKSNVWCVEEV